MSPITQTPIPLSDEWATPEEIFAPRGAGDAGNLVPLCRRHHNESHTYGQKSFEREHAASLDNQPLRVWAGGLWIGYEATKGVSL